MASFTVSNRFSHTLFGCGPLSQYSVTRLGILLLLTAPCESELVNQMYLYCGLVNQLYFNLGCFECKLERVFLRNENFGYIEKDYVTRNLIDCKSATVLDNENGKKRVCFVCFAFLLLLAWCNLGTFSMDEILCAFFSMCSNVWCERDGVSTEVICKSHIFSWYMLYCEV